VHLDNELANSKMARLALHENTFLPGERPLQLEEPRQPIRQGGPWDLRAQVFRQRWLFRT
jgi:hypothetical protein